MTSFDRKTHQEYATQGIEKKIPVEIHRSTVKDAGLGLFAMANIDAGKEVFRVLEPLVTCLKPAHIESTCDGCFINMNDYVNTKTNRLADDDEKQKPTLLICNKCKNMRYCSAECQRAAWRSHHKFECTPGVVEDIKKIGVKTWALVRLLNKYKHGSISMKHIEALSLLQSRTDEQATRRRGVLSRHKADQARASTYVDLSKDSVWSLYCNIKLSTFEIWKPPELRHREGLGIWLDLFSSILNHSCDPNVMIFWEGKQLRCKTLRDISAGEELFVSYVPVSWDLYRRRYQLEVSWFIRCTCKRCVNEDVMPILRCDVRERLLAIHKPLTDTESSSIKEVESAVENLEFVLSHPPFSKESPAWPDHVEPMPAFWESVARVVHRNLQFTTALKIQLRACFISRPQMFQGTIGANWIQSLYLLVRWLGVRASHVWAIGNKNGITVSVSAAAWHLYKMYLQQLLYEVEKCYGTDTALWRGLKARFANQILGGEIAKTCGYKGVLSLAVDEQRRVFTWAGIPDAKGFELVNGGRISV